MKRTFRTVGSIVQGIVLGVLLSVALWKMLSIASGARVFDYQGF
ncbi:hypothetical protein Mal15_36930 [Stieleria maiorica]|uniref:Uncharacterized protein n=1 Tax=Stieleria maiorica TaxID=2795974 RepID=A0A5B9ML40_9BACT|nr:hypothetical protein [Stieleria maiorica]QEF99627.1 hypothetical protein Mal15_36930 [Stieleria maiorica]